MEPASRRSTPAQLWTSPLQLIPWASTFLLQKPRSQLQKAIWPNDGRLTPNCQKCSSRLAPATEAPGQESRASSRFTPLSDHFVATPPSVVGVSLAVRASAIVRRLSPRSRMGRTSGESFFA